MQWCSIKASGGTRKQTAASTVAKRKPTFQAWLIIKVVHLRLTFTDGVFSKENENELKFAIFQWHWSLYLSSISEWKKFKVMTF